MCTPDLLLLYISNLLFLDSLHENTTFRRRQEVFSVQKKNISWKMESHSRASRSKMGTRTGSKQRAWRRCKCCQGSFDFNVLFWNINCDFLLVGWYVCWFDCGLMTVVPSVLFCICGDGFQNHVGKFHSMYLNLKYLLKKIFKHTDHELLLFVILNLDSKTIGSKTYEFNYSRLQKLYWQCFTNHSALRLIFDKISNTIHKIHIGLTSIIQRFQKFIAWNPRK